MNSQEILNKVNDISFKNFEDINLVLLAHKSKFKELGKYEVVNTDNYKGDSDGVKGDWETRTVHFKDYDIYIIERRFYSPNRRGVRDYQGSQFFEVKPKDGKYENVEQLW
jgi:hypothetical protein